MILKNNNWPKIKNTYHTHTNVVFALVCENNLHIHSPRHTRSVTHPHHESKSNPLAPPGVFIWCDKCLQGHIFFGAAKLEIGEVFRGEANKLRWSIDFMVLSHPTPCGGASRSDRPIIQPCFGLIGSRRCIRCTWVAIEIDDIYIPRRYSADAIRLVPRVSNHNTEVYLRRQQFLSS